MRDRCAAKREMPKKLWPTGKGMLRHFLSFYGSVGRWLHRKLYELIYIRVSLIQGCHSCRQRHENI